MADLSKFWRNQHAIWSAEFDQKSMLAREMIATQFSEHESEKLREIINYFSNDDRAAISIMGVLAQVGLAAIAMSDTKMEPKNDNATEGPE